MTQAWEYLVVEEPNASALQERLHRAGLDGWEAAGLGYAGEIRLLALLKRRTGDATDPRPTRREQITRGVDS